MKKAVLSGFLLILFLGASAALRAETPAAPSKNSTGSSQARASTELSRMSSGQTLPGVKTYEELSHAISKVRVESRVRVEKAVEQERVREAWEIGRLIDAHILQHKERADYGKQVLLRLAKDLGMSDTELGYMLQFARAYPISRPAGKLSWSEYETLLAVNDPQKRQALAEKAEKENWDRSRLRSEVKALTQKEKPAETNVRETLTPPAPGQPGTYRIILAKAGPYQGELALDLGFSNYFRLSEVTEDLSAFKEGDLVAFEEKEIQLLGKPRAANIESLLYTYKAWVIRVLDGDTIEVVVDLGFGFTTTQTLRLRGIDCPELVTADGKAAKKFVEDLLKPGTDIYVKTTRSDKYDRYLADVFITDKNGESQYLNNLLLEQGYAVRVHD